MNLSLLGQRALGQSKLYLIKNGPAILTGAGILGFVGTTVLVARAAVKAKPEIDDIKHDLKCVEQRVPDADWTQKDKGKDYATILLRATRDIGKIYAPAVIVGAVSITCVVSAHGMLRKQNAALVAAYTALDAGFKMYRQRVIEEFGEEKDRDIFQGVIARREEMDEDGKPCIIEDRAAHIPGASVYCRFFDEYSTCWSNSAEYNKTFLMAKQNWFNDRLISRGHLFLNEVYEELGLSWSQSGQVVGWKYYPNNDNPRGDNYVDIGIFNPENDRTRAFINGHEAAVFLDFNVDGIIIHDLD